MHTARRNRAHNCKCLPVRRKLHKANRKSTQTETRSPSARFYPRPTEGAARSALRLGMACRDGNKTPGGVCADVWPSTESARRAEAKRQPEGGRRTACPGPREPSVLISVVRAPTRRPAVICEFADEGNRP